MTRNMLINYQGQLIVAIGGYKIESIKQKLLCVWGNQNPGQE
jgi:hypothetical protein